jgi:hypothetical protein
MLKLNSDDKFEITNLIHLFFQLIDSGFLFFNNQDDEKTFSSLFHSESKIEIPFRNVNLTSKESYEKLCKSIHSKFKSALHNETNIVINDLDSINDFQGASNVSYW